MLGDGAAARAQLRLRVVQTRCGRPARWPLAAAAAAGTAVALLASRGGEQSAAPPPRRARGSEGLEGWDAGGQAVSAAAAAASCPPPATGDGPPPEEQNHAEPQGVHAAACALRRLSADLPAAVTLHLQPPPGPAGQGGSYFSIAPRDGGGVVITGDTPLALLSGAKLWLRDWLNSSVTWTGSRVAVPSPAPAPQRPVRRRRVMRHAYYGNVCTSSYSFWNWGWARWERELDWMALNGIDLPLIVTGQEWVLNRMYLAMGFTRGELNAFFTGPAFLAWHRMGNLQRWAGPLTDSWMEGQRRLTRRIIARAKALGMSPVLPAFHGHVPRAAARVFPGATLGRAPPWFGFKEPYSGQSHVEPADQLYVQLGRNFSRAQREEYGSTHWYAVDQFNELAPRSRDGAYLSSAGRALWQSISADDPDARWIVQGWELLRRKWSPGNISAYLSAVPYDRVLVLDLMAEKLPLWEQSRAAAGHQFVWCILNSFGGTVGLSGDMQAAMADPYKALGHPELGRHMAGVGLTMEGIEQNTVLYELVLDHVWEPAPRPVVQWTQAWARARYGLLPAEAGGAWAQLATAAYRRWASFGTPRSAFVFRPSLRYRRDTPAVPSYDVCGVVGACAKLVAAGAGEPRLLAAEAFRHDLVEVCQAVAADVFREEYGRLHRSWEGMNLSGLLRAESVMKGVLSDMDELLGASPLYLLGRWIQRSLAHAVHPGDEVILEHNARNQLTRWGPQGELADYAAKHWSGLLSGYYAPRWALLFDEYIAAARRGHWSMDEEERFGPRCGRFEQQWQWQRDGGFSTVPRGAPLQLARRLLERYAEQLESFC
eukprot:TRINITY_DN18441_c1_g1_i1.p1 TRINITY_DN18441_c1_g1~~TRINITY_DN18441_c1_g1_i1.p1  ORF type:complete len:884 (+),score=199.05 TRINITY_DN18441_c1_g1_i1:178-2652(+)